MERILLLVLIFGGLYWLFRRVHNSWSAKSHRHHIGGSSDFASSAGSMSLHATPGNNLLADKEKIWKTRCQHVAHPGSDVADFNDFEDEPAYDGYSRSDRYHLSPAHIQEEKHIDSLDDLTMPKFKPSKSRKAANS
jgi:hypothetical protein